MDRKETEKSGAENASGAKQDASPDQAKRAAKTGGRTPSKPRGKHASAAPATNAKAGRRSRSSGTGTSQIADETDAVQFLKQQHAAIRQLITACEGADESDKPGALGALLKAWANHTRLEEDFVVPLAEQVGIDRAVLGTMQVRRDLTKILAAELNGNTGGDEFLDAKLGVLSRMITEIMQEEEKPRTGVLALLKGAGTDLGELGERLKRENDELDAEGEDFDLPAPMALRVVRSRQTTYDQEKDMPNNNRDRDEQGRFTGDDDRNNGRSSSRYEDDDRRGGGRFGRMPERDENGRFMSEDDDNRGSSRGSSSRSSRGDYDDDRRGGGRSGRSSERDENGRFMSDDDDNRGSSRGSSSRSRGNYDDDDRGSWRGSSSRGGGQGQGGWFGDSQGHSEASRRGWEEREGWSSRGRSSRDDDDDRRSSRGGNDDDRRSSRSGSSGGRSQGGWFGDSEGHSEAARRGWEEREGSNTRGRSSRDDDDDRRSSRGGSSRGNEGRGGWFGDSEGHSEAARRGWEEREGSSSRGRSSRDDDDDRRSSRSGGNRGGQGHGGWFGDSEGHSEAARRGWEEREGSGSQGRSSRGSRY
jgi:hypothetical protein